MWMIYVIPAYIESDRQLNCLVPPISLEWYVVASAYYWDTINMIEDSVLYKIDHHISNLMSGAVVHTWRVTNGRAVVILQHGFGGMQSAMLTAIMLWFNTWENVALKSEPLICWVMDVLLASAVILTLRRQFLAIWSCDKRWSRISYLYSWLGIPSVALSQQAVSLPTLRWWLEWFLPAPPFPIPSQACCGNNNIHVQLWAGLGHNVRLRH